MIYAVTRAQLLRRLKNDHETVGGYLRWGERLWGALIDIGVNVRPLLGTEEDPWRLSTLPEVESWLDQRTLVGDDDQILRIQIVPL